jgi:hypothetical protein
MNSEVERVWTKLAMHQNRLQNSTLNVHERRLVVEDFAATVMEIGFTTPARLEARVGWSITPSQHYDETVALRSDITHHFCSLGDGRWQNIETEVAETDEEIIDWMLHELDDWVAANGRRAKSEDES